MTCICSCRDLSNEVIADETCALIGTNWANALFSF